MKKIIIILSIILLALVITGCSQKVSTASTSTTNITNTIASANEVTIKDSAFSPATLTVKAGTTVTWTNQDSVPHQVASGPHPSHTDLPGLKSNTFSKGQSYSFTFTKTGTFGYHCHLHPSMQGNIIVE